MLCRRIGLGRTSGGRWFGKLAAPASGRTGTFDSRYRLWQDIAAWRFLNRVAAKQRPRLLSTTGVVLFASYDYTKLSNTKTIQGLPLKSNKSCFASKISHSEILCPNTVYRRLFIFIRFKTIIDILLRPSRKARSSWRKETPSRNSSAASF